jgi:hypothetical protein
MMEMSVVQVAGLPFRLGANVLRVGSRRHGFTQFFRPVIEMVCLIDSIHFQSKIAMIVRQCVALT